MAKEFISILWRTFNRTCKFFNDILKKKLKLSRIGTYVKKRCMWWLTSWINKRAITRLKIVSMTSRGSTESHKNSPTHMMALKPPSSLPLCSSKLHKFNNYEKAPNIVYSYPLVPTGKPLCPAAKLTSHQYTNKHLLNCTFCKSLTNN